MAKIFETSEDISKMIHDKFDEAGLNAMGINLKVLSVTKQKDVAKVSKTSATTAFLTHKDVQMVIYEEALDRLPVDMQERLVEMYISNIFYDTEKDKLVIETNPYVQIFNMRKKYPSILDDLEASYIVIKEIEEEEKERKQEEKEAKKARRQ